MHKDMLLTTLIELQRQKAPQIKKISQWWLNTWIRGLCGDKNHMMALDNAAGSIGKMLHTKGRKALPTVFFETSLTWEAIPSLEAQMAWVLLLNQGRVYTGVPFIKHIFKFYCVLHLAGTKVLHGIKTLSSFKAKFSWPQFLLVLGIPAQTSSALGVPPPSM